MAGSQDEFEIFVWAVKTGRLLDVLAAHTGPVAALAFSPAQPLLASASWDKTVRTWDVFGCVSESTMCTSANPITATILQPGSALSPKTHAFDMTKSIYYQCSLACSSAQIRLQFCCQEFIAVCCSMLWLACLGHVPHLLTCLLSHVGARVLWRSCSTTMMFWHWPSGLMASCWLAQLWMARSTFGTHKTQLLR